MSLKEQFTARFTPRREALDQVPGVYLRVLSLRSLQEEIFPLVRTDADITAPLLRLTLCDEAGAPIFATDAEVAEMSAPEAIELAKRAAEINGLSEKAEKNARKN